MNYNIPDPLSVEASIQIHSTQSTRSYYPHQINQNQFQAYLEKLTKCCQPTLLY